MWKKATASKSNSYDPANPFWNDYLVAKKFMILTEMAHLQAMQQCDVASPVNVQTEKVAVHVMPPLQNDLVQ